MNGRELACLTQHEETAYMVLLRYQIHRNSAFRLQNYVGFQSSLT